LAKLLIGSEKVTGVQKWYGSPLSPCQVWWYRASRAGCRWKVWVLQAGLPAGQHAGIAFTQWFKNGFLLHRSDTLLQ